MIKLVTTSIAGFITPSKKELNEWVKRKRQARYLVHSFVNYVKKDGVTHKEYWGVVIGKVEEKE